MINRDILRYKVNFLTLALLFSYAYIHVTLTGVYVDTQLKELTEFSVRLPFGQRVLIPGLVHYLHHLLPFEVDQLFFLTEWLFVSLLYFALRRLLTRHFEFKVAQCLSWLFILLLPLVTVINYRFTTGGEATFFFPWDTAALFFIVAGLELCLAGRWFLFIPWVFLATLNRETSIILILFIPALYWPQQKWHFKPFFFALCAYGAARFLILICNELPGSLVEWHKYGSSHTHFEENLSWLFSNQHIFLFIFCFAGLPLLWFAFYDFIPLRYRPLRYVCLFSFLNLLCIGNFIEARLFGEITVLLYLPVCVALRNWFVGFIPAIDDVKKSSFLKGGIYYLERYAVIFILIAVYLFKTPLNHLILWLFLPV